MRVSTSTTQPASAADGHWFEHLDLDGAVKAAQDLASQVELPEFLDSLMKTMVESAGAQRGYLLLPGQDQWEVARTATASGSGMEVSAGTPVDVTLRMTIVYDVARTREPVLIDDAATVRHLARDGFPDGAQTKSILCLPLLSKGKLPGIVYLENHLTPHAFPPSRLKLLELLATQAAMCLQNASLVGDLKRAESSVHANEERFRHVFENVPLCIFEVDLNSAPPVILSANRRAEAVYGWSAEEFNAMSLDTLVPPEARQELGRLADCVRAGETVKMRTTNRRRDGAIFPAQLIATPEMEMGPHADHMVVAVEDVTAETERRTEVEAIDVERRRIAQEIHDGLAQDIATLRLRISVWHDIVEANPAQMHAELDELQAILDRGLAEMRRAIFALRPVALDEVGLFPALRQLAGEFETQYQAYVDLRVSGPEERLPLELELPLFRIVQEALRNVGKHALASLVWIGIDLSQDSTITVTVRDNGLGFDPASLEREVRAGHVGLKQMRERAEKAQGALEVNSQPGQWTEVRVVLPLE